MQIQKNSIVTKMSKRGADFGIVVKTMVEMSASHIDVASVSPGSGSQSQPPVNIGLAR